MHASSKNTNTSPDDGNDDFEWFKNQQNLQKPAFETTKSDDIADSKAEFENMNDMDLDMPLKTMEAPEPAH